MTSKKKQSIVSILGNLENEIARKKLKVKKIKNGLF